MGVTLEEFGLPEHDYKMRFLDSVETYCSEAREFKLRSYDKNEEPLKVGDEEVCTVRFAGPHHARHPVRYVRGLLLGRLSRIHQLAGNNDMAVVEDIGRMLKETLAIGYSCRQLRNALFGLRQVWAQPAVRSLLSMLAAIEEE